MYVLPSIAWGSEFLAASPTALKSLDRALRRWGRFLLGWPTGSPNVDVLVELGWPDAERISSGRLLSLFGRVTSMTNGPLPVAVFQAASRMPGTWATRALNMCHSLGAPLPDACGVISGSPPSLSQRRFESQIRHLLDDGLYNRVVVGIASLSVVHFPPSAFSVGGGPDPTAYGRGSSPDHARALDSPDGAMIRVKKVAQPGIGSCLLIAVSVTMLLKIWRTACLSAHGVRICEQSGAVDVAFQSRQLPCGAGTRGFSTQLRSSTLQGRCALI